MPASSQQRSQRRFRLVRGPAMPADHDTRPLGRTGIDVLPLGIGTNKWRRADREAVLETYRTIHDAGPCMIDTAEIYFSERVVGDCLRAGPTRAVIASKFLPLPGRTSPRRLMSALDGSLARLGLRTIDLYYVHYPLPFIDVGVFAEGLVEAVKSGKARAVGVANFNADQMRRIADHLARAGVPLAANQVNYRLLRRAAETNGVLEACRELDVALDDRFHETGIEETGSMELEGCWWIPRLRLAERGAVSWQDGVKRARGR